MVLRPRNGAVEDGGLRRLIGLGTELSERHTRADEIVGFRAARCPRIVVVRRDRDGPVGVRRPQNLGPRIEIRVPVDPLAVVDVVEIALVVVVTHRQTCFHIVADGTGNETVQAIFAIRCSVGLFARRKHVRRRIGRDLDHTGGCRFSKQRTLRTAQHDNLRCVGKRVEGLGLKRLRNVVDEDAHACFGRDRIGISADAANIDAVVCRLRCLGDGQVGRDAHQIVEVADVCALENFRRGHKHRLGNVLNVFRPLVGGDDDFFDACSWRRLRDRDVGAGRERAKCGRQPQKCFERHWVPLPYSPRIAQEVLVSARPGLMDTGVNSLSDLSRI